MYVVSYSEILGENNRSTMLKEIEMNATYETDLAQQYFVKLFSQELEEKSNDIYCTVVEGKELLNQTGLFEHHA